MGASGSVERSKPRMQLVGAVTPAVLEKLLVTVPEYQLVSDRHREPEVLINQVGFVFGREPAAALFVEP